jgi:hypothetical protein
MVNIDPEASKLFCGLVGAAGFDLGSSTKVDLSYKKYTGIPDQLRHVIPEPVVVGLRSCVQVHGGLCVSTNVCLGCVIEAVCSLTVGGCESENRGLVGEAKVWGSGWLGCPTFLGLSLVNFLW